MLRSASTILTIAAMLAHSVFGCTACHAACGAHAACGVTHGGHVDEEECSGHHSDCHANCDDEAEACNVADPGTEGDESHRHPAPASPCRGSGCSYVTIAAVKAPSLLESAVSELLPSDLASAHAPAQLECLARANDGFRSGYPPQERAQLWTCVWQV